MTDGVTAYVSVGVEEPKDSEKPLTGASKEKSAADEASKARGREEIRAQDFIMSLTDTSADSPLKQALAFFLKYLVKPLIVVAMVYIWIGRKLYAVYQILPVNVVQMTFGIGLCFFGGVYFTSIAAIEAFRNFGGQALLDELAIVYEQGCLIQKASEDDDKVDANKDGVADVTVMSTNELVSHKAKVAMVAVTEPQRLMMSVQFLLSAYVAVLATLKMQFAKTVALSLGIAEMLSLPAVRIFGPLLAMVMGKDLQHWVATIIVTAVKVAAVIIATYIQAIISAVYSGMRGGRLFAEGLINIIGDKLPACAAEQPFNPDKSYLDEIIGFPLAAVGFWYQFTHGFTLEFPYSLVMAPCTVVEWILRWQVFTA